MAARYAYRSSVLVTFLTLALTNASAQIAPQQAGVVEYKFGEYTFKLMNKGQVGQVFAGPKVVGTIYTVNGEQQVLPVVPEPDATKLKKAFEEWKSSGRTGSAEPPKSPITFEADGSAVVPLQDGTVVSFTPTSVEVIQPSGFALLPGQAPVTNVRFALKGPGLGKELFGNHTGIFMNGSEVTFGAGFGGGRRKAGKVRLYYLKPMVDGPITTAAALAPNDPNKPANSLDYKAELNEVSKRVDYRF